MVDEERPREVRIQLNGAPRTIPGGSTVLDLLALLELPRERVAVEVNGEIVRKAAYADSVLGEGSRVEVVGFVGGGR